MFSKLIEDGRILVARLEKYRNVGIGNIPTDERMASSEIKAWYDASSSVIGDIFGKDSFQLSRWDELLCKHIDKWHEDDNWDEISSNIVLIHEAMGLLSEFDLVYEAQENIKKTKNMGSWKQYIVKHHQWIIGTLLVILGLIITVMV